MKNNIFVLIVILAFVVMTFVAFVTDTKVKKVNFKNQEFIVKSENVSVTNRDVELKLEKPNIENKELKTEHTSIAVKNEQVTLNENKIEHQGGLQQENSVRHENIAQQQEQEQNDAERKRYMYKEISWNKWQSDFVNKILYDERLMQIMSTYGYGAWFYYTFDVMNTGAIRNVRIFSFYLSDKDKAALRDVIRSYAYKEITVFPANSKRKKARVDAFVVLSDEFSGAHPSDFNKKERVRVEY